MTHSQECSLIRVDPVPTFCHHLISTKRTNYTTFSSEIIKKRKEITPFLFVFHVSYTLLFLTHNILRISAMSQTNVLETCSPAIIRVNAVRNSKSLRSSQWLTGQQGGIKVRPECDQVCSTCKILHDLSSNHDKQGLHSCVCSIVS